MNMLKALWTTKGWLRLATGIIVGGLIGYGYYFFIGCRSGSCAITGNPMNATLYGAVMGLVWMMPGLSGNDKRQKN